MGESVQTGGMMQFNYQKEFQSRLPEETRFEIKEAYERHYEEKDKRRKKRNYFLIVLVILMLIAVGISLWFYM